MSGTIPAGSTPGTVALLAAFPQVANMIQDGWLYHAFDDALFPAQMYRGEAQREPWEGGKIGETTTFTRRGNLKVRSKPRKPNVDPTPQAHPGIEQWTVTARPYNDTIDTHIPTSDLQIAETFTDDGKKLGMQAGQTLDHVVRNRLFNAYIGGQTYIASSTNSANQPVASLQGFGEVLVNGRPTPVSAAAPLDITVGGSAYKVIGALPDDPTFPEGSGTLILNQVVSTTAGDAVLAVNRPYLVRAGGAATVNGIAVGSTLKWAHIRTAITRMRTQLVRPFSDGFFHVHMDSVSESQLFTDDEFKLLFRGTAGNEPETQGFEIGTLMGAKFVRNEESPKSATVDMDDDPVAFDTEVQLGANAGVPVHRVIVLAPNTIKEKYLPDHSHPAGILGKIGKFSITHNGLVVDVRGVKYLLRMPLDRLQEVVAQTWSFKGDWAMPTDSLTGDAALYKRAVVIEHAG